MKKIKIFLHTNAIGPEPINPTPPIPEIAFKVDDFFKNHRRVHKEYITEEEIIADANFNRARAYKAAFDFISSLPKIDSDPLFDRNTIDQNTFDKYVEAGVMLLDMALNQHRECIEEFDDEDCDEDDGTCYGENCDECCDFRKHCGLAEEEIYSCEHCCADKVDTEDTDDCNCENCDNCEEHCDGPYDYDTCKAAMIDMFKMAVILNDINEFKSPHVLNDKVVTNISFTGEQINRIKEILNNYEIGLL